MVTDSGVTGGCHCGAVRFEVTVPLRGFMYCHCHSCRRIHGTVHGSSALVAREGFQVVAGADSVSEYESSPGKKRCFCCRCGSHVYAVVDGHPDVFLRLGTLDGDPGVRAEAHIWVNDKAPWYEINDELPRFPEGPDRRG